MRRQGWGRSVGLVMAVVVGALAGGCATGGEETASTAPDAGVERTDTQIFVGDTIEMNYDSNVIMKRAEAFHDKEGYAEAIVEYEHFLELHRQHVLAPYAQYRLALSHFKMMDTVDRDMTPVARARGAFVTLLTDFEGSQYEAEALASIRQCDRRLAQHHVFVGKFYYRREAYLAAARRFRKVVDTYPRLDEAVESKLYLAKTYHDLGMPEWARDWAVALVEEHPRHALRGEGLETLAALRAAHPDLIAADAVSGATSATSLASAARPAVLFAPGPAGRRAARAMAMSTATTTPATSNRTALSSSFAATECRLGTWCGGATATVPSSIPTSTATTAAIAATVTPSATECRLGDWCGDTAATVPSSIPTPASIAGLP